MAVGCTFCDVLLEAPRGVFMHGELVTLVLAVGMRTRAETTVNERRATTTGAIKRSPTPVEFITLSGRDSFGIWDRPEFVVWRQSGVP